jgi:putative flavoprotein involved in K+ transport
MADKNPADEATEYTLRWLAEFEAAVQAKDSARLGELFTEVSYWRDLVSFTWDFRQVYGRAEIERLLLSTVDFVQPANFRLASAFPPPAWSSQPGADYIEAFIEFDTAQGRGAGFARLNRDDLMAAGVRAWGLYTKLETLKGYEPAAGRPLANGVHGKGGDQNWLDQRNAHQAYADRDPEVIVAGGGHSGIMAAYYLQQLGVDVLIIDKNARVGDNWRNRYYSLALHNPIKMVEMPGLPYPENFPEYMPKDKLANWLEAYVDAMDLNFWTSTEFLGGDYDERSGTWTVTVRRGDGTERVMHSKHVILSTGGVGGAPKIPELPGADTFTGPMVHSSAFATSAEQAGRNVLVVGTGTSAHDIAFDLYNSGAEVTMLQRNPTTVVNLDTANMAYLSYLDGTPVDICDFKSGADFMYLLLVSGLQQYTQVSNEIDRDLHERLEAAGLRLDVGEDDTGWLMKFLRIGGGYYLNVGASDVIAAGKIKILQSDDVDQFLAGGVRLKDGTTRDFDLVVLATGWQNQQAEVAKYFGPEVAERVGEIGGFAEDGELRNAWRPTAQPGLWIMIGGFQWSRSYGPQLALQIKAYLAGLVPDELRGLRDRSAAEPVGAART